METAPAIPPTASKTTPRDFFLWAGALIALYGSAIALITLLFEYVNHAFPDPLAYSGDMYSTAIRTSMATLIVLVPTAVILFRLIRGTIKHEPGKAMIWVRRWALVLTLFIAGATIAVDLITLINTFLGGETTVRFLLKVAIVLLTASAVFMHFLADLKGYWVAYPKRANVIGVAVIILAIAAIVSGFFVIGSPTDARLIRYDQEKQSDLQSIQYAVLNYYQQQSKLPATLGDLQDPLSDYNVDLVDPQNNEFYGYEVTGPLSFKLCTTFNKESLDLEGKGSYPGAYRDVSAPGIGLNDNWKHDAGETCYDRTIDPKIYRQYNSNIPDVPMQ